ncbi:hypothetical protein AAFN47_18715 [Hoeflea sp. CAU 1731]
MGNFTPRVDNSTFAPEEGELPPKFKLGEQKKTALSQILSADIPDAAFESLEEICNNFLYWRILECGADQRKSRESAIQRMRELCKDFADLAHRLREPESDVTYDIAEKIGPLLNKQRLLIDGNRLESRETKSNKVQKGSKNQKLLLRVDIQLLAKIAQNVEVTIEEVQKEYAREDQASFKKGKGDAFDIWLMKIRRWAEAAGLRHSEKNAKGEPSDFARLLKRLSDFIDLELPEGMQVRAQSASAIAKRFEKARAYQNRSPK